MTVSVEDNLLRCFKKFGDKAAPKRASTQLRWRSAASLKAIPERADRDDAAAPAAAAGGGVAD